MSLLYTTKRHLLGIGVGLLSVSSGVPHAHGSTCSSGVERLDIELLEVTIDGVAQETTRYASLTAKLRGDIRAAILELEDDSNFWFSRSTTCGGYISTYDLQPEPPAPGAHCSHEGLHCHWPDVAELCAARCSSSLWHVGGCSEEEAPAPEDEAP